MLRPLPMLLVAALATAADEDYRSTAPANQRPMLGVEMSPVPTHVQEREGLTPHQGVLVQSTYSGTAAEAMGLQRGDVILAINGAPIGSMTDLRNEVGLTAVGEPIEVTVIRQGQTNDRQATVREWPAAIPYEKLDSESERRFRDWQERRQARQAEDLRRIAQEAEDLRRRLTGEDPAAGKRRGSGTGGQGQGGADGSGLAFPAVRVHLVLEVASATVDPATATDPGEVTPLSLVPGLPADEPWVVRASLITL